MRSRTILALWVALLILGMPRLSEAGCGCDHPPPAFASIMPPFGSPGTKIRLSALGTSRFSVGRPYKVDFGGTEVVTVTAQRADYLVVTVPAKVASDPGPKALKVQGAGYDKQYLESDFTALPPAYVVPASGGSFASWKVFTGVTTDGTLLIPVDVSQVLDPMHFAFHLTNLGLTFGHDDVVIYNANGVDLTLFSLMVDNPIRRFWGDYHGWRVEDDTGLYGDVYEHAVMQKIKKDETSDILGYWRHEFHTYKAAHGTGSHTVDANGFHPDGTLHIDHGKLVIAIHGMVRKGDKLEPITDKKREVDLVLVGRGAPGPMPRATLMNLVNRAVTQSVYQRERNFVERVLVKLPE